MTGRKKCVHNGSQTVDWNSIKALMLLNVLYRKRKANISRSFPVQSNL